jgi:hypothetical protein
MLFVTILLGVWEFGIEIYDDGTWPSSRSLSHVGQLSWNGVMALGIEIKTLLRGYT